MERRRRKTSLAASPLRSHLSHLSRLSRGIQFSLKFGFVLNDFVVARVDVVNVVNVGVAVVFAVAVVGYNVSHLINETSLSDFTSPLSMTSHVHTHSLSSLSLWDTHTRIPSQMDSSLISDDFFSCQKIDSFPVKIKILPKNISRWWRSYWRRKFF